MSRAGESRVGAMVRVHLDRIGTYPEVIAHVDECLSSGGAVSPFGGACHGFLEVFRLEDRGMIRDEVRGSPTVGMFLYLLHEHRNNLPDPLLSGFRFDRCGDQGVSVHRASEYSGGYPLVELLQIFVVYLSLGKTVARHHELGEFSLRTLFVSQPSPRILASRCGVCTQEDPCLGSIMCENISCSIWFSPLLDEQLNDDDDAGAVCPDFLVQNDRKVLASLFSRGSTNLRLESFENMLEKKTFADPSLPCGVGDGPTDEVRSGDCGSRGFDLNAVFRFRYQHEADSLETAVFKLGMEAGGVSAEDSSHMVDILNIDPDDCDGSITLPGSSLSSAEELSDLAGKATFMSDVCVLYRTALSDIGQDFTAPFPLYGLFHDAVQRDLMIAFFEGMEYDAPVIPDIRVGVGFDHLYRSAFRFAFVEWLSAEMGISIGKTKFVPDVEFCVDGSPKRMLMDTCHFGSSVRAFDFREVYISSVGTNFH